MRPLLLLTLGIFGSLTLFANELTQTCSDKEVYSDKYNYCNVIYPGVRDLAGRYCINSFGVVHGGYIVDNRCFYSTDGAYQGMRETYGCSFPSPVTIGACEIFYPSQRDLTGHFCANSYGVGYEGVITDNSCFQAMDVAIRRMQTSNFCQNNGGGGGAGQYYYCHLMTPGVRDRAGRYCDGGYGYEYEGYIADNSCYPTTNRAYAEMSHQTMCENRPPYFMGRCGVFNPDERDRQGHYCNNSYGIDVNGYILHDLCYETLGQLRLVMEQSPSCH